MAERVLDERAADLEDALLVAEPGRGSVHLVLEAVARALRDGFELLDEELGDPRQVDGLALDAEAAGVEPGEVEQLSGELRQPLDLLAHAAEELLLRGVVQVLVDEELEVTAEREERRAELVGGVGDELAARMLEAGEALPHAVEGARELAELVGARVDDRLVEPAARDPLGGLLEPADAPREQPRARRSRGGERPRARSAPRSAAAS